MVPKDEVCISKLSNGVRVITEVLPNSKSVAMGIWVGIGSRDEKKQFHGCSHFLEHLLFKGTKSRSAKEISSLVEERGGYLNAFTDRDMTCYHARVLGGDLPVAVDVLFDMVTNPLLKSEDIDTERTVVLSEIDSRDDDPGDLINDLYFEVAWGSNEAAHSILGEKEILQKMSRQDIQEYFSTHYTPNNMIVTAAGNLEQEKLLESLEKRLSVSRRTGKRIRGKPRYEPVRSHITRASSQVQVALTAEGAAYDDPERDALQLISSYLGVGASSKLFQEVREKRGLVYSIFSTNYSLEDAGLFTILAGTQDKYVEKMLKIELQELAKLGRGLSQDRLETIKHKTIGFSVLRSESVESRMVQLGVSTLRQGEPKTLTEAIKGLSSVKPESVKKYAEERLHSDALSLTTLGLSGETAKKVDALF
jgi:predicted Zn-dependent peptidase